MSGVQMHGRVTYPTPNMEPQHYKTYRVLAPVSTHWVPAKCEDVDCLPHREGFSITVDENLPLGQGQAHYIRHDKTRMHKETRLETGLTKFDFPAGTTCFAQHKKQIRPDQFVVDGGDWRGNPMNTPRRIHTKAEYWVEDFAENQDRLKTMIERG